MKCAFEAVVRAEADGSTTLTVTGTVIVANPGVTATFAARVPQGINPAILLMTLVLEQQPGMHTAVQTERALNYTRTYPAGAAVPLTVEVHTTSGETFTCEIVRAH